MWSSSGYAEPALSSFADRHQYTETRTGVRILASLAFLGGMLVAAILIARGADEATIYTVVLLVALALHIGISTFFVQDTRALQLLGIVFLIICAVAITLLAHRTREINEPMMAAMVLVFVSVSLVPWALREVLTVIGLSYTLLTVSLGSVPGRFEPAAFVTLQMLIVATATVVIFVSGRSTLVRKHELRARFELEDAHRDLERLSMQDSLTCAWNRRFLKQNYTSILKSCEKNDETLQMAVLDVDEFKGINDQLGHHAGDQILIELANVLARRIGDDGNLVRLGGDEFLILYCGPDLRSVIDLAIAEVQKSSVSLGVSVDRDITLSAGIASTAEQRDTEFEAMYKAADAALYQAKELRSDGDYKTGPAPSLAMSGRWKL